MKSVIISDALQLQDAIDNATKPTRIILKPGIYYGKFKIKYPNITIEGENPENTIITYNDYAKKIHSDGLEYNTFRTYTVIVLSDQVTFKNLTIENSSGPGKIFGQAVALHVMGNDFKAENCIIKANQDTLFTGPLPKDLIDRYEGFLPDDERLFFNQSRQYYKVCTIIGDVDFIFGCGNALFDCCDIINIGPGYVSAPATEQNHFYGHTFLRCHFISKTDESSVFLARPWRDFGKAVFINCVMDSHVRKEGYHHWEGTKRFETCRFFEYGSNPTFKRVSFAKSLSEIDSKDYAQEKILSSYSKNSNTE